MPAYNLLQSLDLCWLCNALDTHGILLWEVNRAVEVMWTVSLFKMVHHLCQLHCFTWSPVITAEQLNIFQRNCDVWKTHTRAELSCWELQHVQDEHWSPVLITPHCVTPTFLRALWGGKRPWSAGVKLRGKKGGVLMLVFFVSRWETKCLNLF